MKVLLINIALRPNSENLYFPVGIGYIATAIKNAGYDLTILDLDAMRQSDESVESYIRNTKFDVYCMGCIITGYKYVKWLSFLIKKYHSTSWIIVGNTVATFATRLLLTETKTDVCVIGEGDNTIVDLLRTIEKGNPLLYVDGICYRRNNELIVTKKRALIKDLDKLPFIDYTLFLTTVYLEKFWKVIPSPYPSKFLIALPMNSARGCPHDCTFCSHAFKGRKPAYRMRSVGNIVKEAKRLKDMFNVNYIHFADELTFPNKKRAVELAEGLKSLKMFWCANCRADLFKKQDLELLRKMRDAGCVAIGYSLESANPTILKAMNKHITPEGFKEQTEVIQEAGIIATTSIVIGYPQETKETLEKTFKLCYDCNIYPSVGFLLPLLGTKIYDLAVLMGLIKDPEQYLINITDRQVFQINFTSMEMEVILGIVEYWTNKINEKMGLGLDKSELIKSKNYRGKKNA